MPQSACQVRPRWNAKAELDTILNECRSRENSNITLRCRCIQSLHAWRQKGGEFLEMAPVEAEAGAILEAEAQWRLTEIATLIAEKPVV